MYRFLQAMGATFPTLSPAEQALRLAPIREKSLVKVWQVQQRLSTVLLQMVVAWGTDQVRRGREAVTLAKVHTDVDIQAFEVAFFDETR